MIPLNTVDQEFQQVEKNSKINIIEEKQNSEQIGDFKINFLLIINLENCF